MPPCCRFHELAMLCHEHAYTSKLPYLDAEYSIQAEVEANADKKIENYRRKEEKRQQIIHSEEEDNGIDRVENSFLPGLVGSAVLFEEDQFANYLEKLEEDEDSTSPRKRKKRRQFNYCLPIDFKELVSELTLCQCGAPPCTYINVIRLSQTRLHQLSQARCVEKPSSASWTGYCPFCDPQTSST